jgi:hypothetical protein
MDTTSNRPHGTTATAVITRHTYRQGQANRHVRSTQPNREQTKEEEVVCSFYKLNYICYKNETGTVRQYST